MKDDFNIAVVVVVVVVVEKEEFIADPQPGAGSLRTAVTGLDSA